MSELFQTGYIKLALKSLDDNKPQHQYYKQLANHDDSSNNDSFIKDVVDYQLQWRHSSKTLQDHDKMRDSLTKKCPNDKYEILLSIIQAVLAINVGDNRLTEMVVNWAYKAYETFEDIQYSLILALLLLYSHGSFEDFAFPQQQKVGGRHTDSASLILLNALCHMGQRDAQEAVLLFGDIERHVRQTSDENDEEYFKSDIVSNNQAVAYLQIGDPELALSCLLRIDDISSATHTINHITCLRQLNKVEASETLTNRLLDQYPDHPYSIKLKTLDTIFADEIEV